MLTNRIVFSGVLFLACSGDPHLVGVANGGGGAIAAGTLGGSSSLGVGGSSTLSAGGTGVAGGLGLGGLLGLGGAGTHTGGSAATGTGGANCACVRGAYVPVCGNNGTTYDATCGDSCVPVPIACRHACPCTGTGGASSVGGSGSSGGASSTSTSTSGVCGSGCNVAQTTMSSLCTSSQVMLLCTGTPPSNLSTIMTANGCTDAGIDAMAYCCPTLIQTACKSLTI